MLLAINIGNTNYTFGVFDKDALVDSWKIRNHKEMEFQTKISELENIDGIIISSVVPSLTPKVLSILAKLNLTLPLIVSSELMLPIKLATANPEKVGADLIANLCGANYLYKKPLIVLDCGTATTFCILNESAEFDGAIISPGLDSITKSLTNDTALLPKIEIIKPDKLVGQNTIEAMQSGVYFGYVGLVRELLTKLTVEFPEAEIIATGGNIDQIREEISLIKKVNRDLVLLGLGQIYYLNS